MWILFQRNYQAGGKLGYIGVGKGIFQSTIVCGMSEVGPP